jgi:hypothetical protein
VASSVAGHISAALERFAKDGNAKAAYSAVPTWLVAERSVLGGLVELGATNYLNALGRVRVTTTRESAQI